MGEERILIKKKKCSLCNERIWKKNVKSKEASWARRSGWKFSKKEFGIIKKRSNKIINSCFEIGLRELGVKSNIMSKVPVKEKEKQIM